MNYRPYFYASAAVLVGVALSLMIYFLTRKPPVVPADDVATPCPAFSCDSAGVLGSMRSAFDNVFSRRAEFMPDGQGRPYTMRGIQRSVRSPSRNDMACVVDFDYDPPHRDALSRPGYTRQEFVLEPHGPASACRYVVTNMQYPMTVTPVAASPLLST